MTPTNMIPEFLHEFKDAIMARQMETIRIQAAPIPDEEPTVLSESKFLGAPFLPKNVPYPLDKQGKPMVMLAQINFKDVPELDPFPTSGILQLYIPSKDWYMGDDYRILFHGDPQAETISDFSFLTAELLEECPIYRKHRLTFRKELEYGDFVDHRFQLEFNGLDLLDFHDTLPREQGEALMDFFTAMGHKMGGYSFFTQYDPRADDDKRSQDVSVLQIDSGDQIMFGDSGVAHILIHPDDLRAKNFTNAYFYWDCC